MDPKDLMYEDECAEYRRCSVFKLQRERHQKRGPRFYRLSNGRVAYAKADVDAFERPTLVGTKDQPAPPPRSQEDAPLWIKPEPQPEPAKPTEPPRQRVALREEARS